MSSRSRLSWLLLLLLMTGVVPTPMGSQEAGSAYAGGKRRRAAQRRAQRAAAAEPGGPTTEPGGPTTEPDGPTTEPDGPTTEPGDPDPSNEGDAPPTTPDTPSDDTPPLVTPESLVDMLVNLIQPYGEGSCADNTLHCLIPDAPDVCLRDMDTANEQLETIQCMLNGSSTPRDIVPVGGGPVSTQEEVQALIDVIAESGNDAIIIKVGEPENHMFPYLNEPGTYVDPIWTDADSFYVFEVTPLELP